jgi:hypothetical protein
MSVIPQTGHDQSCRSASSTSLRVRWRMSDIGRGARNVSLVNFEHLAQALGLSLAELFADVDQR